MCVCVSVVLTRLDAVFSPVDDTLHAYLLNVTFLDEDALHKQSLECEPPAGGVNSSADEGARTSIFDATGKLTKGAPAAPQFLCVRATSSHTSL